jgi:hypothetical protein
MYIWFTVFSFWKNIIYQISQFCSIPHDTRGIVTELQV